MLARGPVSDKSGGREEKTKYGKSARGGRPVASARQV